MEHVIQTKGGIVKLWLRPDEIEESAASQIAQMAEMPMLFKHLAIMPDCHFGKGATIGAVMALRNAIVPNCVGVDIGCGMATYKTGLYFEGELAEREFWQKWKADVDASIPTGFGAHLEVDEERNHRAIAETGANYEEWQPSPSFLRCYAGQPGDIKPNRHFAARPTGIFAQANCQLGTLGGGNHFIEVQRDERNEIWIMVHSGSRGIGLKIAEHYDRLAKAANEKWHSPRPPDLHWLPLDDDLGQNYLHDMNWAVNYALANRLEMLGMAIAALSLDWERDRVLNIPHNYAAIESHYGTNVVVHRKGATRARDGEIGIIPGSMGTHSYIVKGKGNIESYTSCSHGAGRRMGRRQAVRELDPAAFTESIAHTFSSSPKEIIDESPAAYKDIETVMARQADLIEIVHTLEPIITVKGGMDEVLD